MGPDASLSTRDEKCIGNNQLREGIRHEVRLSICYFRRRRSESLWTSAETGKDSPVRREQEAGIEARAIANAEQVGLGKAPDLEPYRRAGPVRLDHLAGPALPQERR